MKTETLIYCGSLSAIAAALELKANGKEVLLFTHRTYLGEDLCDSLRLVLPEDPLLDHPLAKRLFGDAAEKSETLRPMHIKHELDQVLEEADIPVMLGTAPAEFSGENDEQILRVHNRSGDFDISFETLLDGSLHGDLLRLAGVPLSKPQAEIQVTRRVIGGEAEDSGGWTEEGLVEFPDGTSTRKAPLWSFTETVALPDPSWSAWMELEQQFRMQAYRPGQDLSADGVFALTGEHLDVPIFDAHENPDEIPAEACSAMNGRIWSSSAPVAVDDLTREKLLRPDHSILFGKHVASLIAANPSSPSGLIPPQSEIILEVDVLVVGGGTGGAPAGIAAARSGKTTLVAEFLSGLGGVGTLGLIGKYWYGNRVGFTAEVDQGARDLTTKTFAADAWDVEAKMQWYHSEITKAGGKIWYKTMLSKALWEGDRVTGAVLCTPRGEITVHAKCVVDASGAAAVAASAGAETVAIGQGRLAMQGTGLPGRNPGANYTNTDYDFVDDGNAEDVSSAHVTSREKFKQAFDAGQHVDTRERRRVVGDYEISPMDIRLTRVFPDSVIKAQSNFDTHGYTVHPLFMIVPPDHDEQFAYIPLRALLPKGLKGILVTGLGISAHRDAMPVIRMQADVQNQGYAAGVIAAMAGDRDIRDLEILEIQGKLVEKGILAPEIKGASDSFPLPEEEIEKGLKTSLADPDTIDRVFTLPEKERMEKLHQAYREEDDPELKAHFAFVLGVLGDDSGYESLVNVVSSTPWDEGWNYTGMGQFGESMSRLDARIIALGRCKNPDALPVLAEKVESLPEETEFSHFRVLAEALETIGSKKGVPVLESLLKRPGVTGHHLHRTSDRLKTATADSTETRFRNSALIELHLATSLHELDPENESANKILKEYTKDIRGLFSAHAKRMLD